MAHQLTWCFPTLRCGFAVTDDKLEQYQADSDQRCANEINTFVLSGSDVWWKDKVGSYPNPCGDPGIHPQGCSPSSTTETNSVIHSGWDGSVVAYGA